jgi:DNA polymerase-4
MIQQLYSLLDDILESLSQRELLACTFTIKVKYSDFTQVTRSYTSDTLISVSDTARQLIPVLLAKTDADRKPVRLLGVSFSNLMDQKDCTSHQLALF